MENIKKKIKHLCKKIDIWLGKNDKIYKFSSINKWWLKEKITAQNFGISNKVERSEPPVPGSWLHHWSGELEFVDVNQNFNAQKLAYILLTFSFRRLEMIIFI